MLLFVYNEQGGDSIDNMVVRSNVSDGFFGGLSLSDESFPNEGARGAFAKRSQSLREASVGTAEAFAKPSRSLLGGFSKPSAPATSSRSAREDVANPSRRRHGEPTP